MNLGTGGDLVVFLDGGGACWDATTCYLLAEYFGKGGPYGETQFEAELEAAPSGAIEQLGMIRGRRDDRPAGQIIHLK